MRTTRVAIAGGAAVLAAAATLAGVGADGEAPTPDGGPGAGAASAPRPKVDRFDSRRAWRLLRWQVALGPRPAGSAASRRLARRLRSLVPRGRYEAVPGGLRNVYGVVRGRLPHRLVVVGAHYDTKDTPGFVGANDGASGTAVVAELARSIRPRRLRPTVVFAFFDGEESPRGSSANSFVEAGLRGSKVAARTWRRARAMVLLDFVGDRRLRIPRERLSHRRLWRKLRIAARRVGVGRVFPRESAEEILDDHVPFIQAGVPAIDLIDFDFPCFHQTCDDLSAVSQRSLDATGEAVLRLLATL